MMTFRCVVMCSLLMLLLLLPASWCGRQDRVERSLPDLQAPFRDLLAEVRPFTNESSGSLLRHVTTMMSALTNGVSSLSDVRGKQLFPGATPVCLSCQVVTKIIFKYFRTVPDPRLGVKIVIEVCRRFVFKRPGMCEGLIKGDASVLEFITRHSNASSEQLCHLLFSARLTPAFLHCGYQFQGDEWAVNIPPKVTGKLLSPYTAPGRVPPVSGGRDKRRGDYNGGRPYLKMLHLTDLHYDPNYLEGSNAKCGTIVCCQKDSGRPLYPAAGAGKWGDYRICDSPERLVVNLLDYLRTHHPDIDYILYSGDSVAHDIWRQSKQENTLVVTKVEDFLSQYFPTTPIFGALGNHDSYPRDSFPPPEDPSVDSRFNNQELYDVAAEHWQRHLPNVKISEQARVSGCYSALLKPGFRIISINTIFCFKFNLWVLYKNTDPGNVLRWLVQELLAAEQRGERVQIVGHVAPLSGDCYEQWGHQFNRIVTRFSDTIRGQFYGHSHLLEVYLNYDVNNPHRPVGAQYLTPSNTPFSRYNPTFTLFYIDGDHPQSTRAVLDTETFYMNLTAANRQDDVRWLPLYSARADLGLDSLEPHGWEALVRRMDKDPELIRKFYRYQVSGSDAVTGNCGRKCSRKIICAMVDGDKFLPRKCRNN